MFFHVLADSSTQRHLLALLPEDEPQFEKDLSKLRALRSSDDTDFEAATEHDRSLHKALVELTVARPLGGLLDIGCGQGRILKLLASRAHRSVGVDVDKNARRLARAEMLLAGIPNCSLRQGEMTSLPFDDGKFDTIILDDVLTAAADPGAAITEAVRLLTPSGRILILASVDDTNVDDVRKQLTIWAAETNLRMAAPRAIPSKTPGWLLAVATPANRASVAA